MTTAELERLYEKIGYDVVTRDPVISTVLRVGMRDSLSLEDTLVLLVQTQKKINDAQQAALIAQQRVQTIRILQEPPGA